VFGSGRIIVIPLWIFCQLFWHNWRRSLCPPPIQRDFTEHNDRKLSVGRWD